MALTPLRGNNSNSVNSTLQSNPGDRVSSEGRSVGPIVAILSRQMPLPLAQQLAGQTALVKVVKNDANNQAELELNGQQVSVKLPPGKSLTPGEFITVSFALSDKSKADGLDDNKSTRKTSSTNPLLELTTENEDDTQSNIKKSNSFISNLSSTARLIGLIEKLGQPKNTLPFQTSVSTQPIANLLNTNNTTKLIHAEQFNNAPTNTGNIRLTANSQNSINSLSTQTLANGNTTLNASSNLNSQNLATTPTQAQTTNLAHSQPTNPNLTAQPAPTLPSSLVALKVPTFSVNQTVTINPAQLNTQKLSSELAQHVSQAVENSGLFYESHLQQWAKGDRTKAQLLLEPQARFGAEQTITDKNLDANAMNQSVKMVAHQLNVLDQSKINISLVGLLQNPVEVEIEAEKEPSQQDTEEQQETVRPWTAKLKLDMPTLGPIDVKLRMIGDQVDLSLSTQDTTKQVVDQYWRDIENALKAKGLKLTHGQVRSVTQLGAGDG